jgi:hypothetical protein
VCVCVCVSLCLWSTETLKRNVIGSRNLEKKRKKEKGHLFDKL